MGFHRRLYILDMLAKELSTANYSFCNFYSLINILKIISLFLGFEFFGQIVMFSDAPKITLFVHINMQD